MDVLKSGNPASPVVLIQPVDGHSLAMIEKEIAAITEAADDDFLLLACKVESWNRDLSPWEAPAVFGRNGFVNGAQVTLNEILKYCADSRKTYYIGGYSLAGLFALLAACQTNAFKGVAAASPSVWFPGFTEYLRDHPMQTGAVCLSLGDRVEKHGTLSWLRSAQRTGRHMTFCKSKTSRAYWNGIRATTSRMRTCERQKHFRGL